MLTSIIIVNYQAWDFLDACLASLLGSGPERPPGIEIIVVDNRSEDGNLERFARRFPQVTFIRNSANYGFANGCNLGAQYARGDLMLFLNPDVVATTRQVEKLLQEKESSGATILTAKQLDRNGRMQKAFDAFPRPLTTFSMLRTFARWLRPRTYPNPRANHADLVLCDWVSGSLMLIAREDFEKLGGWNEDFWMYGEDTDLCARAHRLGMRVAYTPHAEFVHLHGGASRQNTEINAITRSESVISKHVYVDGHFRGLRRGWFHFLVAGRQMSRLFVESVLDILTLRRVAYLRMRSLMWVILVRYYRRRIRSGSWISFRSANFHRPPSEQPS
jgi:GT2 family glycosyltransferase